MHPRFLNLFTCLFCIALIAGSFYIEFVQHVEPCTLCIIQRFIIILLAIFFALGFLLPFSVRWGRLFHQLGLIIIASGMFISLRHIWLQYMAQLSPSYHCGPTFKYIIENFGTMEILRALLASHEDCTRIDWTLLGISLPSWVLICFVMLGGVCIRNLKWYQQQAASTLDAYSRHALLEDSTYRNEHKHDQ